MDTIIIKGRYFSKRILKQKAVQEAALNSLVNLENLSCDQFTAAFTPPYKAHKCQP